MAGGCAPSGPQRSSTVLREVIFISQTWAQTLVPQGSESLISITGRGVAPAQIQAGWQAVLRIQFDDVDPDAFPPDELSADLVPLSSEQAGEIAEFARAIAQHSATLVVHCRHGQSRSPGVAKAICQHFGLAFPAEFNTQNEFVYRKVLHALALQSAGRAASQAWPPGIE